MAQKRTLKYRHTYLEVGRGGRPAHGRGHNGDLREARRDGQGHPRGHLTRRDVEGADAGHDEEDGGQDSLDEEVVGRAAEPEHRFDVLEPVECLSVIRRVLY